MFFEAARNNDAHIMNGVSTRYRLEDADLEMAPREQVASFASINQLQHFRAPTKKNVQDNRGKGNKMSKWRKLARAAFDRFRSKKQFF